MPPRRKCFKYLEVIKVFWLHLRSVSLIQSCCHTNILLYVLKNGKYYFAFSIAPSRSSSSTRKRSLSFCLPLRGFHHTRTSCAPVSERLTRTSRTRCLTPGGSFTQGAKTSCHQRSSLCRWRNSPSRSAQLSGRIIWRVSPSP